MRQEDLALARLKAAEVKYEVTQELAAARLEMAQAKVAAVHAHLGEAAPPAPAAAQQTPPGWLSGWLGGGGDPRLQA